MKNESARRKIAVIVSNMEGEYVSDMLIGIENEAFSQGIDVYIFNANASADEKLMHNVGEYMIYNLIDYSQFDGVLLFGNLIQGYSVYNAVVEKIKESGIITVSIDAEMDEFCSVGGADYEPMKKLVEHLIEHHHFTKINYISGQDHNTDSIERLEAYCDALREHDIPVEEERIFRGAFTSAHGRESARKMLEAPHMMPEAIVCATDSIACGVRNVFLKYGIQIPQQVALTGFDDIFEARNSIPRLTTVARDPEAMGSEAVRTIVRLLNGEEVPKLKEFQGTPVFRESCGCCAQEADNMEDLRRKYIQTAKAYERVLHGNNMMTEEISASKNFEHFMDCFTKYMKENDSDGFYLCLDKRLVENLRGAGNGGKVFDEESSSQVAPEIMTVAVACEKGKVIEGWDFPIAQMTPKLPVAGEPPHSNLFVPLHFRERCMGYLVVKESRHIRFSPLFRARLLNLSNGLESLRKQIRLQAMVEELDKRYVTDSLTGLYNRFGLARYTSDSFIKCVSQDRSFMIMVADLDGLKEINDKFGHDNGDVAISAVAYALQEACEGGEICARIGGDEFVVYADGYMESDARNYCRRLEKLICQVNKELKKPYQIRVSYGYEVAYPEVGETFDQYMELADSKMYIDKKKNKELHADNVRIVT